MWKRASVRRLFLAGAVAPWLIGARFLADDPANWTPAEWVAWRDAEIDAIFTPTFEADGEKRLARSEVIRRCSAAYEVLSAPMADPGFLADPVRGKILGNFARFVKAQHWMAVTDGNGEATHALGMDISDRDYWDFVRPHTEFPELLQRQRFLQAMRNPASYKAAVDMIAAHNATLPEERKWVVLPYRAQFIQSVDRTTYGRLLVMVPNERTADGKLLDRWLLFAIATPDMARVPEIMSVSMVSTVRDPLAPGTSKAYFADFLRVTDRGTISVRPNFLLSPNPSKNCYDCHKSAVLPIRPKVTYRFDGSGRLVESGEGMVPKVNALIREYGRSDFGHLDGDAYGPSLGGARDRSDGSFAAQGVAPASFDRVRANMNCASCHDGFAKLNYLMAVPNDRDLISFEAKESLVKTFIEKGFMPPGNTLSSEERAALYRCVTKEYLDFGPRQGALIDWLKGREG